MHKYRLKDKNSKKNEEKIDKISSLSWSMRECGWGESEKMHFNENLLNQKNPSPLVLEQETTDYKCRIAEVEKKK